MLISRLLYRNGWDMHPSLSLRRQRKKSTVIILQEHKHNTIWQLMRITQKTLETVKITFALSNLIMSNLEANEAPLRMV
jgi:hypothetical protein